MNIYGPRYLCNFLISKYINSSIHQFSTNRRFSFLTYIFPKIAGTLHKHPAAGQPEVILLLPA